MNKSMNVRQRVIAISLGWVAVAIVEAAAYLVLALSIAQQRSPIILLLTALLALLVTLCVTRAGFISGVRLAENLYNDLTQKVSEIKLSWFDDKNRALLVNTASRAIPSLMSVPAHQLQSLIYAPLIPLLLVAGVVIVAGWLVAIVTIGLLGISLTIQFIAQRYLSKADAQRHSAELTAMQSTLELVDHLELLRTAAGSERALDRLEQCWEIQEAALTKTNNAAGIAILFSTLAKVLPLAGLLIFILFVPLSDLPSLLALFILTMRAAAPLEGLALAGLGINELRSTVADYKTVLAAPCLPSTQHSVAIADNSFRLERLSYGSVLTDVDVVINEGTRVAITGGSGSGKSTLLRLLMRFDDPDSGVIYLGNAPLTQLRYQQLVEKIAYVAQEPVIFTGTLAQNIRQGNEQATAAQVEQAAQYAQLGEVIVRSALGIEQHVGHQGAALSGGERQRVALARAFLKQAPILILDEATSALDQNTEQAIIKYVQTLTSTVLLVTHRDPANWQPTQYIAL
ncbi:ABC transporter ATP-binding protein [Pseudomonas sp. F1_0610]|uniref:ATP-binding cassette domain-containing protein n=1 Tax=Pseudomonas sp. F1_0610 TaxID=3114284 RepID=UPI0039C44B01